MAVTLSDSTQVLTCAYACGFRLMKSEALLEIFCGICHIKSNEVSKAIVTERKFWNALQQFLPDEIPEEVHSLLASIFHSCTSNLGANIKWSASLAELICILSLFCGGSKPQKLAFTFYIFGEVEDGIVKEEEFLFMLSTILKGVCLLTAWGQNQDPGDLSSWAQMASEVTLQVRTLIQCNIPISSLRICIIMMIGGVHPSPPVYIIPMDYSYTSAHNTVNSI